MADHTLDSDTLRTLLDRHAHKGAFAAVAKALPLVWYEVMALGQAAIVSVHRRPSVRLKLDDGRIYRMAYDHATHTIVLYRLKGWHANGPIVAHFDNASTQAQIRQALHPKTALAVA